MTLQQQLAVGERPAPGDTRALIEGEDEQCQRVDEIDVGGRGAISSPSPYCTGSTDSQFDSRMKVNSVTASGSAKGAIFMPMALST